MLVNLDYVLKRAQEEKYGVGLFNTTDTDMLQAVIEAAEECRSPVIIGTAEVLLPYGELALIAPSVIAAAKRANAHSFITMLPDGYNTVLKGDGSGLSQGQRQLISIARAAEADPPVMILDEATSSIDTRTEAIVSAGMDALMQGRTVFVIAHRLSTIKNSDVIMVLDHGRIIERGSHDELIAAKGKYYQLYTGSFDFDE